MSGVSDNSMREQSLVQTGSPAKPITNSSRAGFLPVSLEHMTLQAVAGIGVYIRMKPETETLGSGPVQDGFRLYCNEKLEFTDLHRQRLLEHDVKFAYIRIVDQSRFRRQIAANLDEIASSTTVAEASSIIYETSVELVNELLQDPETLANSPRLGQLSRGVTTLVLKNPSAFGHLFAASHHDFYTATHMVNVGAWMVPLALELGIKDPAELDLICRAGLMHDMGKIGIPETILNKTGKLSDEEWSVIRKHPEAGYEYLRKFENIDQRILRVAFEHHERLDGTGYPRNLKADDIHLYSRICAVVDSFDAMTAFRPFKTRTMGVNDAMAIMKQEAGTKYDPDVMAAWCKLVAPGGLIEVQHSSPLPAQAQSHARAFDRHTFHCPARLHAVKLQGAHSLELPAIAATAHSISRSGVGLLSQTPLEPGHLIRVYLQARGWQERGLEGEVVRCRSYNDQWHEIGVRFTQVKAA